MNCETALALLDDRVDGCLDRALTTALDEHLETCAACRDEERSLHRLLESARELSPELRPGRNLWPEVVSRIEGHDRPARGTWLSWAMAAAAAAAVGLGAFAARPEPPPVTVPEDGKAFVAQVAARPAPSLEEQMRMLAEAEAEYERASAALLAAVESMQDKLPPDTLERTRVSLTAIDAAREQVHQALRADPGNSRLIRLAAATDQRKVALLQRLVRLSC